MVWIRIPIKSTCYIWLIYHINAFPPTAFFSFIPPASDPLEKPSPFSCSVFHMVDFANSVENLTLSAPIPPHLFSIFSVWLLDIETWGDSSWNFTRKTSWVAFCPLVSKRLGPLWDNIISPSITELHQPLTSWTSLPFVLIVWTHYFTSDVLANRLIPSSFSGRPTIINSFAPSSLFSYPKEQFEQAKTGSIFYFPAYLPISQ